jgi:hypothetical protein
MCCPVQHYGAVKAGTLLETTPDKGEHLLSANTPNSSVSRSNGIVPPGFQEARHRDVQSPPSGDGYANMPTSDNEWH